MSPPFIIVPKSWLEMWLAYLVFCCRLLLGTMCFHPLPVSVGGKPCPPLIFPQGNELNISLLISSAKYWLSFSDEAVFPIKIRAAGCLPYLSNPMPPCGPALPIQPPHRGTLTQMPSHLLFLTRFPLWARVLYQFCVCRISHHRNHLWFHTSNTVPPNQRWSQLEPKAPG